MNLILIGALAIVIIVYVLLSKKENKEAVKKTTPKEDAGKFFHHFSQTLIYAFILMVWGLRWIFGVFKDFVKWYKGKKDEAPKKTKV
jgi:SNF family Na+-dependent transporter